MAMTSGDEWELISDALIKEQDEGADFFARPVPPGENLSGLSEELQSTMSELQDDLVIGGTEEEQAAPMDVQEDSTP